jgi:hypothetical protein
MRKQLQRWFWLIGMLVVIGSVIGCNLFNADQESPTAPADGANYAQLPDEPGCSAVRDFDGAQHQFNLFVTPFAIPYGDLLYVELNEQLGVGKAPGVDQIPVNLQDVTVTFSQFPAGLTGFIVLMKEKVTEAQLLGMDSYYGEPYLELARYNVQDGAVSIPVDWGTWITYYGPTHYSVWFSPLGSGYYCGRIDVTGSLPDGQQVTLGKGICFGANPPPPAPVCKAAGAACISGSECCSGRCGCGGPGPYECVNGC